MNCCNNIRNEKAMIMKNISGENLFTITGLDGGIDPEEASERGWAYGNVKKISLGVRLSF